MKKAASLILVLSIFLSVLPVAAANDYDIIIQGEEFSGYTVDGTQKSIIELASAGNTSAEGGGEGVDVGEDIAKSVFLDPGNEAEYDINVSQTGIYTLSLNAGVRRIDRNIRPIIKVDGQVLFDHTKYTELAYSSSMKYTTFTETKIGSVELIKGTHKLSVGLVKSEENEGYAKRFLLDNINISFDEKLEVYETVIKASKESVVEADKYDFYTSVSADDKLAETDIDGAKAVAYKTGEAVDYRIAPEKAGLYEIYAEVGADEDTEAAIDIIIGEKSINTTAELKNGSTDRILIGKLSVIIADSKVTFKADANVILKSLIFVPVDESAPEIEQSSIIIDAKDVSAFHTDTSTWVAGEPGVVNGGVDHAWRNPNKIEASADTVTFRILDWLEYEIEVPEAGRYMFSMFVGSDRNVPFVLTVNGDRKHAYEFNMTLTDQHMTKTLQDLAIITLEQGKNTLRLTQEDESKNFNASIGHYRLVYLDDFPVVAYRANNMELDGADGVFRGTDTLNIHFGSNIDADSMPQKPVTVTSAGGTAIDTECSVNDNILIVKLKRSLDYSSEYSLVLDDNIKSIYGVKITGDKSITFKTADNNYDIGNDTIKDLYVNTDHELFTFGGRVFSSNELIMAGRRIVGKIYDPSENYIDSVQGISDGKGDFELEYTLAKGSAGGYYRIEVKDEYSTSYELQALYVSDEVESSLISDIKASADAAAVKEVLQKYEPEIGYSLNKDLSALSDKDNFYEQFVGRDLKDSAGFVSFYDYVLSAEKIRQSKNNSELEDRLYDTSLTDDLGIDPMAAEQISDQRNAFVKAAGGISDIKNVDEYTAKLKEVFNKYIAEEFSKAPELKEKEVSLYVGQGAEIPVAFTTEQTEVVSASVTAEAVDKEIFNGVTSSKGTIDGTKISFTSTDNKISGFGSFTVTAPNIKGQYKVKLSGDIVYLLNGVTVPISLDEKEVTIKVSDNTAKNNHTESNSGRSSAASYVPSKPADPSNDNKDPDTPNGNDNTDTDEYRFTDLGGYSWAEDSIYSLLGDENSTITKNSEKLFRPGDNITREEFTKMIVTALGIYDKDADTDAWYSSYIASAANNGIVNGYDNGDFGIGDRITRQDATLIADRCVKEYLNSRSTAERFSDDDLIADYAKESVYRAERGGVVSGMGDGTFAPRNNMTRAQAAVLINNLIKKASLISASDSSKPSVYTANTNKNDKNQKKLIGLMKALEIIPEDFAADDANKKAQRGILAYALDVMAKGQAMAASPVTITDMDTGDELYESAEFALSSGLMSADDGLFDPDGACIANEAAKAMAKVICGYGIDNEYTLGQAQTDICSGVKINSDGTLSYAELFRMIKNALTAEIFEYGTNNKSTLLANRFRVSVYKGTVQTVNPDAYNLNVYIKEDKYKTNPKSMKDTTETYFAGENVNLYEYEYTDALFWVRDDGTTEDTLILIEPDDDVEVKNAYIYSVNGDDNAGATYAAKYIDKIIFYDDKTRYPLADDAKIIYNGIETISPVPLTGNFVRAVIKRNEIMSIQVWDLAEGGLTDSISKNIITYTKGETRGNRIDTDDYKKTLLFIDGENRDIKDLKEKTVFDFFRSTDTLVIVASEKAISGRFDSLGKEQISIGSITYPINRIYYDENGSGAYKEMTSGSGVFGSDIEAFFDAAGYCKYIRISHKTEYNDKYLGIVIRMTLDDPDTEADLLTLYMIEPEVEKKTFEIDKKAKYKDGIDKAILLDSALDKNGENIFEFKFNKDGKITEISEPQAFPGYPKLQINNISTSTDNYIGSTQGTLYVNTDTRIIVTYSDGYECKVEESNWSTIKGRTATGGAVTARVYGKENSSDIRCIVFCGDVPKLLATEPSMGIISKMVGSMNKNDETGYDITVVGMEGEMTYFVTDADAKGLSVGTFIAYDSGSFFTDSGFTVKEKYTFSGDIADWELPNAKFRRGVVKSVDGQMLFLEDGTAKFMHRKFNYVVVDKGTRSNPRFVRGTTADLVPGANIVYYMLGDIQGIYVEEM